MSGISPGHKKTDREACSYVDIETDRKIGRSVGRESNRQEEEGR